MTPIPRVAVYARCSAQKQADKDLSIPAQLDAARAEARRHQWEVVREFVDEAESARSADRPGFQEMIAAARQKPRPFDVIVVWKFSRFARSREDSVLYKRLLEKHGVRLVSLNEPVDGSPAGKMMEGILEVLDEFYSANLAQDTIRGMRKNASRGFHNGGITPTGYRVRHTGDALSPKGVLEPDPIFAPIVRSIFQRALTGQGMKAIASGLNQEGLRTARKALWSVAGVKAILTNEVYTGVRLWGVLSSKPEDARPEPVRVPDAHEALVSADDFTRVQALMASRTMDRIHPRRLSGQYLLSGLLHCALCGKPMCGAAAKNGAVHYYVCQTKAKHGVAMCPSKMVNARRAEKAVAERIREVVLHPVHFADLLAMVKEELGQVAQTADDGKKAIDGQLGEARSRLDRLYEALEEGSVTLKELGPRIRTWKERVEDLERKRDELAATAAPGAGDFEISAELVAAHVEALRDLLAHGSKDERRTFLRAWIRRIDAKDDTLTITYSFPHWPGGDGEPVANEAPQGSDDEPMRLTGTDGGGRRGGGSGAAGNGPGSAGPVNTGSQSGRCSARGSGGLVLPMVKNGSASLP